MKPAQLRRKMLILGLMLALGIIYVFWMLALGGLAGRPTVDGSIGVVLGLYICSHPAANAIDLLFLDRTTRHYLTYGAPGLRWLGLNMLVMLGGWLAIFIGATRFANRGG